MRISTRRWPKLTFNDFCEDQPELINRNHTIGDRLKMYSQDGLDPFVLK